MNAAARRIAIVDAGAFVLPYDFHLIRALAAQGLAVDFYASSTRYNAELLQALRRTPGVTVHERPISRTVAPRWRGALAYVAQLASLLARARRYERVNLQSIGIGVWPLEWLVFGVLLRLRGVPFVMTVHNAVPHGFAGQQHAPTRRLARRAQALVFVSQASMDDFLARYGEAFRARSHLLPHGLLPVTAEAGATPYQPLPQPTRLVFWSRVQPYKGVELFAELARSAELRQRGLALAVYGAWAPELHGLRDELAGLGVAVHDRYLDDAELLALMREPAVFLLPYQRATQSGALYALLNHGRTFFCTDTGDLGAFLRQHGLAPLLLKDRSAAAVLACLDHLRAQAGEVAAALQAAQDAMRWEVLLRRHGAAYATDVTAGAAASRPEPPAAG